MITNIYEELVANSNKVFKNRQVSSYIMIFKNTENERLKEKMRMAIYMGLAKIMIKAINNFNYLVRSVPEYKRLHCNEEIASECYLVLDRCLRNVDLSKLNGFYFYLNSGLNRAMHRIYKDSYEKNFIFIDMTEEEEEIKIKNKGFTQHFNMTGVDLIKLNSIQWKIIEFKMSGEKSLVNFLKRENMESEVYYREYETMMDMLTEVYGDDRDLMNIIKTKTE